MQGRNNATQHERGKNTRSGIAPELNQHGKGFKHHLYQSVTLEGSRMRHVMFTLIDRLQCLITKEDGQDLVEYALIVALIAFAATAGMKTLATGINTAFTHTNTTLGNYTV